MQWGRKKISSSSPSTCSSSSYSRPSLISNVLPSSWVSKFKRMSLYSGQGSSKNDLKGKWDSVYMSPWRGPNEDGGEEDAFWRLSFREEIVDGKSENGSVLRPVWYHNYVGYEHELTKPSSCQGISTREEEEIVPKFSNMVSEPREGRVFPREAEILERGEKVAEIRTPRLRKDSMKKTKNKKQGGKVAEQQLEVGVENVSKMEAGRETSGNRNVKREDWNLAGLDGRDVMDSYSWNLEEGKMLKESKIEEIKERKSLYIRRVDVAERGRPKQKAIKVKSYSPRLASKAEPCKIKALEDMKRAKVKSRKKKEKRKDGFMGLESFAVVKTSLDPHKDFRDSMMEMINERGISRPDDLEELLACYLTLNSDVYHDLIIKAFRQVWFELNQACSVSELENEKL